MSNFSTINYIIDEPNIFHPIYIEDTIDSIPHDDNNSFNDIYTDLYDNNTFDISKQSGVIGSKCGIYIDNHYDIKQLTHRLIPSGYSNSPYNYSMIHQYNGAIRPSIGHAITYPFYLNNGTITKADDHLLSLSKYYQLYITATATNETNIPIDTLYTYQYYLQFNATNNWDGTHDVYIPASYYLIRISFKIALGTAQSGFCDFFISEYGETSPYDIFSQESIYANNVYKRYYVEMYVDPNFAETNNRKMQFNLISRIGKLNLDPNGIRVELVDLIA